MDEKWFKAQQKKAGVTAEDIANVLGRDRSVVSRIYTGRQRMSLEWAKAFAKALEVPLAEVLEHAGTADEETARTLRPGFADSDAAVWAPQAGMGDGREIRATAATLGGARAGIDIWRVKSRAMALGGYLEGDFFLVDTNQSERPQPGDVVLAQLYNNSSGTASTVLRRFQPPVLVASSVDPDDMRVHVVDGVNVVIKGRVIASWRM
jgi:transcriptional regulator with XRE-family HTH domain